MIVGQLKVMACGDVLQISYKFMAFRISLNLNKVEMTMDLYNH